MIEHEVGLSHLTHLFKEYRLLLNQVIFNIVLLWGLIRGQHQHTTRPLQLHTGTDQSGLPLEACLS